MSGRGWMVLLVLMVLSRSAVADHEDHLKAKRLQKSGDIVAVEQILNKVRKSHTGRVIEVDLADQDGRYLYEIELVDGRGEVRRFYFDAKTGEEAKGNFKHH